MKRSYESCKLSYLEEKSELTWYSVNREDGLRSFEFSLLELSTWILILADCCRTVYFEDTIEDCIRFRNCGISFSSNVPFVMWLFVELQDTYVEWKDHPSRMNRASLLCQESSMFERSESIGKLPEGISYFSLCGVHVDVSVFVANVEEIRIYWERIWLSFDVVETRPLIFNLFVEPW